MYPCSQAGTRSWVSVEDALGFNLRMRLVRFKMVGLDWGGDRFGLC